jgi:hypothetical protein
MKGVNADQILVLLGALAILVVINTSHKKIADFVSSFSDALLGFIGW